MLRGTEQIQPRLYCGTAARAPSAAKWNQSISRGNKCYAAQSKFSHLFAVEQLHVHCHRLNKIDQSVRGNKCYAAQSKYSHAFTVEKLHMHRHRLNEINQPVGEINVTRHRANSATSLMWNSCSCKSSPLQSKFSHFFTVEQLNVHHHRLNEIDQPVRDINVTRHRANSATTLLWNSYTCTVITQMKSINQYEK